jgi:hypothetical protein
MEELTNKLNNLTLNHEYIRVEYGENHFIINKNSNFYEYIQLVSDKTNELGDMMIKIILIKNNLVISTIYTYKKILHFLYQMRY